MESLNFIETKKHTKLTKSKMIRTPLNAPIMLLTIMVVLIIFPVILQTVINYLRQGGNAFARLCLFVCLSVCQQDNSKNYGRIFLKFSGNVGNGKNYQ